MIMKWRARIVGAVSLAIAVTALAPGFLASVAEAQEGGETLPTGVNYAFVGQLCGRSLFAFDVASVPADGEPTIPIETPMATAALPMDMTLDTAASAPAATTRLVVAEAGSKQLLLFDAAKCTPANVATASLGAIDLTHAPIATNQPLVGYLAALLAPLLERVQYPLGVAADTDKLYVPSFITTVVVTNGLPDKGLMDLDLTGGSIHSLFGLVDFPLALGAFRACAAGKYIFVTNALTNSVSVIDTVGTKDRPPDEIVASVRVGTFPTGCAYDGVDTVWVTCAIDGEVVPITVDGESFTAGAPVTAGVGPVDIVRGALESDGTTLTRMYVTNFFSGDLSSFDPADPPAGGVPAETIAVSGGPSLMQAIGTGRAEMQQALRRRFAAFGRKVVMGTSGRASGARRFSSLRPLLRRILKESGSANAPRVVPNILGRLLGSFRRQRGATGAPMPVAGLWGIGFARFPSGTAGSDYRLVVANGVTGEVVLVDPVTNATVGSFFPGSSSGCGSAAGALPVSSVEIFDTTP